MAADNPATVEESDRTRRLLVFRQFHAEVPSKDGKTVTVHSRAQ